MAGYTWDTDAYPGYLLFQTRDTSGALATALTLTRSQNATFGGGISMTDSILIDYTGSDGQNNDAGLKIMNDASDWGAYIRKDSNADYGLRIDSGGGNAFNIYSTTGGTTRTFGINGGTGATSITGTESLMLTLNPTANNYGGIWFKYDGTSKGMSVYNSGSMIYGGESGVGTKLQTNGQIALTIDTSQNSTFAGVISAPSYLRLTNAIDQATLPDVPDEHVITLNPPTTTNYYGGGISWSEGSNTAASIGVYDAGSGGALGMYLATGNNTTLTKALTIDNSQAATFAGAVSLGGNLNLVDNTYAYFGNGNDFYIGHTGSATVLINSATSGHIEFSQYDADKSIYFKANDGSGGVSNYIKIDGSQEITEFAHSTKHMDSIHSIFGSSSDASIYHNGTDSWYFLQQADNGYIDIRNDDGSGGTTSYLVIDGNNELNRFYKRLQLEDNVKLTFGNITTPDLEIYHDASNSYITDTGTGSLKICAANFHVMNAGATEYMITGTPNEGVALYYDNSWKITTATASVTNFSGGIDVKSTISGEDLTIELDHDTDNHSGTILNIGQGSYTAGKVYANDGGTWELADADDVHTTYMVRAMYRSCI